MRKNTNDWSRCLASPLSAAALVAVLSSVGCGDDGTQDFGTTAGTTGGVTATTNGVQPTTTGMMASTTSTPTVTPGTTAGTTGGAVSTTSAPATTTGMDAGVSTGMMEEDAGTTGTPGTTTGMMEEDAGMDPPVMGEGECCDDGDCLCHGPAPSGLTSDNGPFGTETYSIRGTGCVTYPTDAEPPFAAVAISDGFLGSGGCGSFQTGGWAEFYASHGIVAMIIETTGADQPGQRATKLANGISAFKAANEDSSSPLFEKLAGRYGTSGFSMGGGGTTIAASMDPSLLTSVAIMPWGPTGRGVTVPTLITCGSSDGTASCRSHGTPAYSEMPETTPKMRVEVRAGHAGQPSTAGGAQGAIGLAFQKVFLEGDERWRSVLVGADNEESNIQ